MIPIPPTVYIIAIAGALSFYGGYEVRDTMASAERTFILKAERKKFIEAREKTAKILAKLENREEDIKIVYKTITKEVPTYVTKIQKTNSACNVSNNVKRMLDQAIDPMSRASPNPNGSDSETSTIREIDLIMYLTEAAKQYNLVRNQCNSLIDWYNKTKD